jgi:hypothetical protein
MEKEGKKDTQHNHRCNGDEYVHMFLLNVDIAGQFPEPGDQPGREM